MITIYTFFFSTLRVVVGFAAPLQAGLRREVFFIHGDVDGEVGCRLAKEVSGDKASPGEQW